MKTAIEVERECDNFFRSIGFARVSEMIESSPPFPNADYLRLSDKMIVELKVLDKDYFEHGGIIDRFCALVPAPVDTRPDGTGLYKVTLPPANREGKCDSFEEPIRRILKKANRQLKETNERLLSANGRGFIVLVMSGFVSLRPLTVARMISELLAVEFRGISGYILCARYPEIWCLSAMAPNLDKEEYDRWYEVANRLGEFLDRSVCLINHTQSKT